MSVEELADLIVDGGVAAIPPSDGITSRYTLEDLGRRLWGEMQQRPPSRRSEWFHDMTQTQQVAVVVVLRDRGFASATIAREFNVPEMEVVRTYNSHADDLGAQVTGLRLNTIAGLTQKVYERAIELEAQKGNGRGMWSIQKEHVGVLQSLGVIDQAVHKSEVTHKIGEAEMVELDALVALQMKKDRRHEEIKAIEAEVTDADPVGPLDFEKEE